MRSVPFRDSADVVPAAAATAAEVAGGGVVLIPTETFYGLAADPRSAAGVDAVYEMKGRPRGSALPVLCADWDQLESLVVVPERFRVRLSRLWPGALTAVMAVRESLAAACGTTLAVRIPGHPLLRALLYRVGPLTATSANRHGTPPCTEAGKALTQLDPQPNLVLDGGATPGGVATTLVDVSGDEPRVLRTGATSWS